MADIVLNGVSYYFQAEMVPGAVTALKSLGFESSGKMLYLLHDLRLGQLDMEKEKSYILWDTFIIDMLSPKLHYMTFFIQGLCGVHNILSRPIKPIIIMDRLVVMENDEVYAYVPQKSTTAASLQQGLTLPAEYLNMVAQHLSPKSRLQLNRTAVGENVQLNKLDLQYEELIKKGELYSLLVLAAKNGDEKMVDYVLMNKAIDSDEEFADATAWAAQYGYEHIVDKMLKLGVNPYMAFAGAATGGNLDLVKKYFLDDPQDIASSIQHAASNGHFNVVKYLMTFCTSDECLPDLSESTGSLEIVEYLMAHKQYSLDAVIKAMKYAVFAEKSDIAKFLISKGANNFEDLAYRDLKHGNGRAIRFLHDNGYQFDVTTTVESVLPHIKLDALKVVFELYRFRRSDAENWINRARKTEVREFLQQQLPNLPF